MTLPHLEYWIMAQLLLEIVLVPLLVFFLWKLRTLSRRLGELEPRRAGNPEVARLAADLTRLEEKRLALEQALAGLEAKTRTPEAGKTPPFGPGPGQSNLPPQESQGLSLRAQVEDLHLRGLSVGEIAKHLGLHPTEVKMALDLARLAGDLP